MNKKTIENLEELVDEAIINAKEKIKNDNEDFNEACNQANNLVRTLNDLKKSEKEEKFWTKDTIIEIVKVATELSAIIINLIGIRSYAKMIMKYEINDGRILTSSPGKGLAGLFRFKSVI